MNQDFEKKVVSFKKDNDLDSQKNLVSLGFTNPSEIVKKTEKLVTAVYLVSGLIPENDPLRVSLRSQSIDFLSFISSIFHGSGMDGGIINGNINGGAINRGGGQVAEKIGAKTEIIISLLNIAFFANYISEMNLNIIKSELEWFAAEIKNNPLRNLPDVVLSDDFLISKTEYKGHQEHKGHETPEKGQKGQKDKNIKDGRKLSRRESVLGVITKEGRPTIKDISSAVRDCSEKTIQRELVSLIHEGIIKRNGERRWSTYSLVGQ